MQNSQPNKISPRVAVVIPACNEAACIGRVLEELLDVTRNLNLAIAVGVNDSSDGTAAIAARFPVIVAETGDRGYGHGCRAAIDWLNALDPSIRAYIFFAGDGASDPHDVAELVRAFSGGDDLVLGTRTTSVRNWRAMTLRHVVANLALGCWCGVLTGRFFTDLGPLRLIERRLFEAMVLQEMTYGWTIEAQVIAAMRGARITEVPVGERLRIGGSQKVSGVSWKRTLVIGCRIVAAGWRTRRRWRAAPESEFALNGPPQPVFVRQRIADGAAGVSRS